MRPVNLLSLCLLFACIGCNRKVDCKTPVFYWELSGFDSSDLSVISVKIYERGSSFSKLLGSHITGIGIINGNGDTVAYSAFSHAIDIGGDLEIAIPAAQKIFRVRDFFVKNEYQQVGVIAAIEDNCSNTVSYYVNDTAYTVRPRASHADREACYISLQK